jgi:tyrosyl-tRNA synthetase
VAIEAIKKHQSAYQMAVGGAANLVSKAIKAAKVVGFADLGMEAIYEFEVKDMPVTVAVDSQGTSVHAIGTPLITDADGKKFGKSEGNAIWLDPEMCSPYAMYQFWLNADDSIVVTLLKVFTFLTRAEIEELAAQVEAEPFRRAAQKRLALEVTTTVHGADAAAKAIAASEALFGRGDLTALDASTLASALSELPNATVPAGTPVLQALVEIAMGDGQQRGVAVLREQPADGDRVDDGATAEAHAL